jgi:putative ABC transport system ATP-binding protein
MIEFKNITLSVHRQTLLEKTRLHVAAGDKVVLRGPSGCGKSSLLKSMVGAIPLTAGRVVLDGLELSAETVGEIRRRIAFIGQEPVLGAATVQQAIMLPFGFKAHRNNPPEQNTIIALLERLHLPESILAKPCDRISGGEKQRVAIARALLLNKTVFLADEASSALDPESKAAVMKELFQPQITLLSVSHDADWVEQCSRIIDIENQTLVEVAP